MSHVKTAEVVIKDIECLTRGAAVYGAKLVRKDTYNWYGESVGDYPLPKGMTEAQLGRCEYAIQLPGTCYEVGVVRLKDGGYTLAWDFYGGSTGEWKQGQAKQHDGQKLQAVFGDNLTKLQQQYNKQLVMKQARAKGYMVSEKLQPNGAIKLQLVKA